ncbi:hypothetical protein ACNZ61_002794 [Enterococcus hirae]
MAKKVLISLSHRNLLINSETLKNVEPDVYSCLEQNKTIYPEQAKRFGILDKINKNLTNWLNLSIKEWKIDRKGISISEKKDYHCDLCNQPIQTRYKIINQKNQHSLYIGRECSNNFKELASIKKLVKNADQLYRYNELINKNKNFYSILTNEKDLTECTEIILPDFYQESYKKAKKKLVKFMRNYIRKGDSLDEQELRRLYKIYHNEEKIINRFVRENVENKHVLFRSVANAIKRAQPKEYKEILKEVEKNRGEISPYTASKIKVPKYLNSMMGRMNKLLPDNVVLKDSNMGKYDFQITKRSAKYHFRVDSSVLITSYYDKFLCDFPKWIERYLGEINFANKESRDKALRLANFTLNGLKDVKVVEPNYHKIVNEYFDDLNHYERSVAYDKLNSLGQSYTALITRGEVRIYVQQQLINLGKQIICLDRCDPRRFLEENHYEFSNIDEYYQFLAGKVVFR